MTVAKPLPLKPAAPANRGKSAGASPEDGLTGAEAKSRLEKSGPNAMPDTNAHPLRAAVEKFWAPIPWMLEAAIVLQLVLGKYLESAIIAGLLVFNAALGLFQESRAQATLAALKSRLALNASVGSPQGLCAKTRKLAQTANFEPWRSSAGAICRVAKRAVIIARRTDATFCAAVGAAAMTWRVGESGISGNAYALSGASD